MGKRPYFAPISPHLPHKPRFGLGMLSNPQYARAWERKQAWYAANGVKEGGGEAATLIVTKDDQRGVIDSAEVQAMVQEIA